MSDEVNCFVPGSEDDVLVNDGTAAIGLIRKEDVQLGDNVFGLSAMDGGGFTGVIVTIDQWEQMKLKVDDYVKKLKEEITAKEAVRAEVDLGVGIDAKESKEHKSS